MLPLSKEELESHWDANVCYVCERTILQKLAKIKNYQKIKIIAIGKYRVTAYSICNLKFNVLEDIPAIFHNSSKL